MNDETGGVPHPPYDQLRKELGDDPAGRGALDDLKKHLESSAPDPATVERHVDVLRGIRTIEARIANWFDDPATQRWFKALSDAGL